ncbi:MAG TPA: hypothetical protein VKT29_11090 [Terriglobales bacterium]|nr:hypothetical protein [Terriglobales bacterium]
MSKAQPSSLQLTNQSLSAQASGLSTKKRLLPITQLLNFDGIADGNSGWVVPDANGAPGATQYVQFVNDRYAVYDKSTGALIAGPTTGKALWKNLGGPCAANNNGDIIANYDKLAGVWVLTQFASGNGQFYQCFAVSTTSDATGSFNLYAFPISTYWPDYPKMGVWPDGYYMSWNLQNQAKGYALVAPQVCAFDRVNMLAGNPATSVCFQLSSSYSSLLPADLDGTIAPPSGSPNYLLNLDANSVDLWQFHADFQTPSNSYVNGPTNIPVNAFTESCGGHVCVPQPNTTQKLDSIADRLMYRLAYRNFGDHESLLANHTVGSPAGVRWYEIRDPGGVPTVYQQGTINPDSSWRWMGSIAMDKMGNIAAGFSLSSRYIFPSINYAIHLSTDPLGTMSGGVSVIRGTGSQTGKGRWGDYTAMTVDPTDDCTFWYTNEYLASNGSFNWRTRIASFKFNNCN